MPLRGASISAARFETALRGKGKHLIRWQPKFVPSAPPIGNAIREGDVDPAALIAALEEGALGDRYACRVIEIAGRCESANAILNQCLERLSCPDAQTEYWLLGEDEECTRALYDAFNHHDAALRFDSLEVGAVQTAEQEMDPGTAAAAERDMVSGLLRPGAAELALLHRDARDFGPEQWKLVHRLLVAAGLALVCHEDGDVIETARGWTTLHAGSRTTLVQAPDTLAELSVATEAETSGPRWVIGEPGTPAEAWIELLDSPGVHHIPWTTVEACDFGRLEGMAGRRRTRGDRTVCRRRPGRSHRRADGVAVRGLSAGPGTIPA